MSEEHNGNEEVIKALRRIAEEADENPVPMRKTGMDATIDLDFPLQRDRDGTLIKQEKENGEETTTR